MEIYRPEYQRAVLLRIMEILRRRGPLVSAAVVSGTLALTGCDESPMELDTGVMMLDAGADGGSTMDAAVDAGGTDAGSGTDAGPGDDAGADASTSDAGADASTSDAGADAATSMDAAMDAAVDAGPPADGGGSITLLSARFVDPSTVRLRLSAPIGALTGVTPDQFRLAHLRGYSYTDTTGLHEYFYRDDLGFGTCSAYYVEYFAYAGGEAVPMSLLTALDTACIADAASMTRVQVSGVTIASGAADELELTLTPGVDSLALASICGTPPEPRYCSGADDVSGATIVDCLARAVVHYRAGSTPVRSTGGAPLGDIDAPWTSAAGSFFEILSTTPPIPAPERTIACP